MRTCTRYCIVTLLLLTMVGRFSAQDMVRMPDDLPEPIFEGVDIYIAEPHHLVWLDEQTFVFTEFDPSFSTQPAYRYDLISGDFNVVDAPIFTTRMPEDVREWYRVNDRGIVFQSPYQRSDGLHDILYFSNIPILCDPDCASTIIFRGTYAEDSSSTRGFTGAYHVTDFDVYGLDHVMWSRGNHSAVIERTSLSGGGTGLYYWNMATNDEIQLPVFLGLDDLTLAISSDGQRVIMASSAIDDGVSSTTDQQLVIWTAPVYDENCRCTYDSRFDVISPIAITQDARKFAGATFVDDDTLLYIGELGLMRHNLLTGLSSIIDADLNTGWIRTAVFSPDNRQVAITTDDGLLYVLNIF